MSGFEAVLSILIEAKWREGGIDGWRNGGWEGYGYAGILMDLYVWSTYAQLSISHMPL